jgi:hypothetical protein
MAFHPGIVWQVPGIELMLWGYAFGLGEAQT